MSIHLPIIICSIFLAASVGFFFYGITKPPTEFERRIAQVKGASGDRILLFRRFYNETQQRTINKKLQEAGWYEASPAHIAFWTILWLIGTCVFACFLFIAFDIKGPKLLLLLIFPIIGYYAPHFMMNDAIKNRKKAIELEIPDFLDMLASTIAAGTALNAALSSSISVIKGPLKGELQATLADMRVGRSRSEALTALAERVNQEDLKMLTSALIQAERTGGNLSQILDELALEARDRRMLRAEEVANTLPLHMMMPMALLLLPTMFVMIFTPLAAHIAVIFQHIQK